MIPITEIDRIKRQVAIADLLTDRGIQPVSQSGGELVYRSPLRDDMHPSFYVNIKENVFKDHVVHEHRGDIVRLVQLLDKVNFTTAVQILRDFEGQLTQPSFFLSGHSLESNSSTDQIREVKLLQTPCLLGYVESRGIGVSIARTYLREVHYHHNDKYLYAVGLPNDRDGFALRNGVGCKRNIGPSDITTLAGKQPDGMTANVFEGSFDFLSALQHYGQAIPTYSTYILNSVTNMSRLLRCIGKYSLINVYFDHDKAGQDALQTLIAHNLPAIDRSELYTGYNDFNEYLLSTKNSCSRPPSRDIENAQKKAR